MIGVQVPDLKLRLDGLKFVSERVEGEAFEARSPSSENYPMPSTLEEVGAVPFKYKFAFAALATIPGIERMIETNDPRSWEVFARNENLDGESPLRARGVREAGASGLARRHWPVQVPGPRASGQRGARERRDSNPRPPA